jgi:hypothetical protein
MSETCKDMQRTFVTLEMTQAQCREAHRLVEHWNECSRCRQVVEAYEAVGRMLAVQEEEAASPRGGWEALEGRLAETARRRGRRRHFPSMVGIAAAAALLVSAGVLFLTPRRAAEAPDDAAALLAPRGADQTDASLTQAFATVSSVFEGRATWVMISDKTSDMGLTDGAHGGTKLLLLRLVTSREGQQGSSMCLAMVPGSTARVSVPSAAGETLEYTIVTSAAEPERVRVAMTVDAAGAKPSGDASITTTLTLPFGKSVHVGQVATSSGPVKLLASLQQSSVAGKGA